MAAEREPVERLLEVLAEPALTRAVAPRHPGEVHVFGEYKIKFHGLDDECSKNLPKFVMFERADVIISLNWIRGLVHIQVTSSL